MTIYNWLTLFGVPGMLTMLGGFICALYKQNKALKSGIRAILRDSLLRAYYECSGRGYATSDERENFENLYKQYHALKGNGVMEDIHQRFLALDVKKRHQKPRKGGKSL